MGHHINAEGQFQSDKHPDLPPDRIRLNFNNPNSHAALWQLAKSYASVDPELAEDIGMRLWSLGSRPSWAEQELYVAKPLPYIRTLLGLHL